MWPVEARLGPASVHPTSAQVRLLAPVLAVTLHTGRGWRSVVSCHSTGPWMVAAVLTTNSSMMTVLAGGIIVSLLLKCDNNKNKNHKQKKMLQYKMLTYKVLTARV